MKFTDFQKGVASYLAMLWLLIVVLFLAGCATGPRQNSFWTQQVVATAWGITMVTPYGPISLGYVSWQRNPQTIQDASTPSDVIYKLLK